jgi:hypothetical protein
MSVQCLACEHVNQADAKFCVECGSRLNLKLCPHCEAINESAAQTCHACGKSSPQAQAETKTATAQATEVLEADSPASRFPAYQAAASRERRSAARIRGALLLSVLAVTAGAWAAYFAYREPGNSIEAPLPQVSGVVTPIAAAPQVPVPAPAKVEVAAPAEPKAAAKASQPAPRRPSVAATSPSVTPPSTNPPRSTAAVTHTRRAEAAPASAQPQTNTQASEVKQAAAALALPPAQTQVSAGIREAQKTAGCSEATVVLGLCTSSEKGKGN